MHRFNFERAKVFWSVEKLPNGMLKISSSDGVIVLPRSAVQLTRTGHLNDMSTRVVDFGTVKKGQKPIAAIIAAGRLDRLPQLDPA